MCFDNKFLGCIISFALGAGQMPAEAQAKPNKKPVILSEDMAAMGNGRRIAGNAKDSFIAVWVDSDSAQIYGRYLSNGSASGELFKIGQFDPDSGISRWR